MNQEPLPQIHLIRDTDLSVFAYELHIFAGDFLRECEFNMRSLATNAGADSIAIMGKNHMWLSDALFAYCSTADLHQMILTTEFIGARAFLFHTDRREGGHLYGDVLMMDLDTLRQDIKRNILYPCGVNIERKDGSVATVSLKEWTGMELYEKDALKSWGFSYAPNQVTEWQYHYSTMFRQWMDQAFRYMPQDLEERLNMQYMEAAQNPDMDKYRIPQGTAKQMLLYDEAPVYRLLPSGSEKIAPIVAISTGLWYENYREFAIAPEDLGALDKLIRRETVHPNNLLNRISRTTSKNKSHKILKGSCQWINKNICTSIRIAGKNHFPIRLNKAIHNTSFKTYCLCIGRIAEVRINIFNLFKTNQRAIYIQFFVLVKKCFHFITLLYNF